jgi:hypothetical protein
MEIVTVYNRTSKPVTGLWDGKPRVIPPHGKQAFPEVVAEAIKRQNVVMGSEDPFTGEMQYLVAILEFGDPQDDIEQTNSITRMNRAPLGKDEEVVKGQNGLYSRRDLAPGPAVSTGNGAVGVESTFSRK